MLDIKFIRHNPDQVKEAIKNKGVKEINLDELLEIDKTRTSIVQHLEQKRGLRNQLTENIAKVTDKVAKDKLLNEAKTVKEDIQKLEKEFNDVDNKFFNLLVRIPNIPSTEMPVGQSEEDNKVLKVWLPDKGYLEIDESTLYTDVSYMPEADFEYKDHVELGKALDIIDVEQSAKVSGSRFGYLKNEAVLIQDAVFTVLKKHLQKKGYMPMIPPVLVKEGALFGTSHFPEGRDDIYKIENFNVEEENELYLVGSSEPANFAYFMDNTFRAEELPIKLFAQTTCFRSEVGSWGRDVRGIKRVHQFDKLEMNAICTPKQAEEIFDEFLATNEWLLQELKLPYRIANKCTGDSGYNASHLQYDFEYWTPSERIFIEGGTNTNTTDYQTRRLNIRYRQNGGSRFAYTINDTGVAAGRMLIAIVENYQQPDGSVKIPEVLQDLVGKADIRP